MADYNQLKASIAAVIKTNNRKEITGQLLQNVLFQMTNVIGENYQLAGFATPQTNPHEPDQNVFYITDESGTFPYFDNIILGSGISFLMWKNGQWTSHTVNGVTQEWVRENFISKEYFRSLFRAYDANGDEILPNNDPEGTLPAVVDNIKAMVGFWTEQYISALGHGTGGGGGGGGGGATTLDGLDDVVILNPQNGQGLIFDSTSGKWINQNIPTGTDMATVWTALAGATNQQINISHLTDALATYATQTWVGQNYISIAYFDRLFRAYNGSTLVSHNDTTSTIDNIKAMIGFWTEFYISALGIGGLQSPISLASLNDIALTTPIGGGQVLTYNATTGKWVNANAQAGVTQLSALSDVTLTSPQTNQVLIYDYGNNCWVNSTLKTVNGYSLIGSGNIDASGGGTGNYVAKAGDTMTGMLSFNKGSGYAIAFPQYYIGFNINNDFFFYTENNISYAIWTNGQKRLKITGNGYIGVNNENPAFPLDVIGYSKSQLYLFRSLSGGELGYVGRGQDNDSVNIVNYTSGVIDFWIGTSRKVIIGGTENVLDVLGNARIANNLYFYDGTYMDIDGNIHQTASNALWVIFSHADAYNFVVRSGDGFVGIGTAGPSYKLHVLGDIYATGAVTALSDARKKDITGEAGVTVEQIADAPAVQFLWKGERAKEGLQVGTLAQYWQGVLPEVVMDKGGELSMQYGVTALVSAIITARRVLDHERRISELERESERLRTEVEQLRLN